MTLDVEEFIHRFLIHVLPSGFHRIRHIGLFANATRKDNLATIKDRLGDNQIEKSNDGIEADELDVTNNDEQDKSNQKVTYLCRVCGETMIIIDTFIGNIHPRAPPIIQNSHD
jgi:hypothetical protein